MKRLSKGFLSALLVLAFLSRGTVALCPQKVSGHDCCGKTTPAAPRTPCPEMACCQVLPAAAPVLTPSADCAVLLPVAPTVALPVSSSFAVCSPSDSGPPGPPIQRHSGLSPPALLG